MRTDKIFETKYAYTLPATKEELKKIELESGGSYLTLDGKLLHVTTTSRPQIANALSNFGKFKSCQNRFEFTGLHRIIQLASNLNVPLLYPKQEITTLSPMVCFQQIRKMDLPCALSQFIDSIYATNLSDRRSVSSDIVLLGAIVVSWKVTKYISIASSTTDAEVRAAFKGFKRLITIRHYFAHLGFLISSPTLVYEDNKDTYDLIESGRQTSRIKHVDVTLCYLHRKYKNGDFFIHQCSAHLMLADGLNKALSGSTLRHHSNIYAGCRFLPPPSSQHHYELIRLCPLF